MGYMAFEIKVTGSRGESPEELLPKTGAEGGIKISKGDLVEDRYHRLRLIGWWDQDLLANSTVVVAGAGALGNEALKNLALLGGGRGGGGAPREDLL